MTIDIVGLCSWNMLLGAKTTVHCIVVYHPHMFHDRTRVSCEIKICPPLRIPFSTNVVIFPFLEQDRIIKAKNGWNFTTECVGAAMANMWWKVLMLRV